MAEREKYLEAGKLTKAHGIKGEMRFQLYCDSAYVADSLETLYMGKEKAPVSVEYCRPLKGNMSVIKLAEINSANEAEQYVGTMLYLDRNDLQLGEDVWFISDLIGVSVYDADTGRLYGVIDDVLQNGGADVYSVKTPEGRQLLFPAISEIIVSTVIEDKIMRIRPIEGLFD